MFKGSFTLSLYEECIKSGLCEEHCKEINQNELAELPNEFPRKAFRYIRINILYPLLFKKTPKCPKIKLLMERTPALAKILQGDISNDVETILTLDSVVVFTLCHLSKICCIGALFHMKKKMNYEDPKLKPLYNLLLLDQLDKNVVQHLYPILQKNFTGFDLDILKASHVITLIFVRNFCSKFNMKIAVENIEKDIKGDTGWEDKQTTAELYFQRSNYQVAADMFVSALLKNMYSSEVYCQLAQCYKKMCKYNVAMLYSYLAVSMNSNFCEAYVLLTESLFQLKKIDESRHIANLGLMTCKSGSASYNNLKLLHNQIKSINKSDSANDILNSSVKQSDFIQNKQVHKKIECVELIDSDSAESEDESDNNTKDRGNSIEDDDANDCITTERQPPSVSEGTPRKPKRNRTLSDAPDEGSSDKKDIDVEKINSLLKEASEALLGDCGYKAVQIFRGPLRDIIENPELLPFEECDVVCMKYSYGMAYCKSGAYDDLQKCISLLKEILSQHESVTFPAVHFSIGLAYRKLNRFKESLHHLETVRSFLERGFHFKAYPWPGTTTVIQETKPDVLKALVEDLMKECENPPNPDACCRFATCMFQPTIYYSDPDFRGYFSLCCSEQCCMQYHLQCWKVIRAERNLTDKEFLEKPCFTPDCEGVIVKIQNIDKKGDLSREFVSDYRKTSKQKRAKSEKKTEAKDRKKKKTSNKCNDVGKSTERKNSLITDESMPSSDSLSASVEETTLKSERVKMDTTQACSEKKGETQATAREEDSCSPAQHLNEPKDASTNGEDPSSDSKYIVDESMRENLYSYMADFLHHHGPLKVNDTLLVDEMSSFPSEAITMINDCGGIGEFLKQDLKFAYVGDTFVCHVIDVARAYKMNYNNNSGLPSEFEQYTSDALHTYSDKSGQNQNCGLNPNAQEYKPSNVVEETDQALGAKDQDSARPTEAFKSHLNHSQEVIRPTSVSESELFATKIKSGEMLSNQRLQKSLESKLETVTGSDLNVAAHDEKSSSGSANPDLETAAVASKPERSYKELYSWKIGDVSANQSFSNSIRLEVQLQSLITQYFSKEKESSRQYIDSYIKPYVINKKSEYASTATMTDPSAYRDKSFEDNLAKELDKMAEKNLVLIKSVEASTRMQNNFALKITQLQKRLEIAESQNKEFENKEQDYLERRQCILKTLSEAHKTIDEQSRIITSLCHEKESLEKNVENLTHSHKMTEEKVKIALETQEKQFNERLKYIQNENADLKNRAKYAELQVLHCKKTEHLKKINAKIAEAIHREKEITKGLSVMSCSPVILNNMKVLSAQILVYVNKLKTIKQEFSEKIDKEIEQVKNGTPLKGTTTLEVETELPEIPCLQDIFPANTGNMPFNMGMGVSPVPAYNAPLLANVPHATPAAALIKPPPDVAPVNKSQAESTNKGSLDFTSLNSQIQESFKSGMASINSFASAPYPINDEFQKNCLLFKDQMPMTQPEKSKFPPGISQNPVIHPASQSRPHSASSAGSIDSLSKIKVDQSVLDVEKKKAVPSGKSNYEKLLNKLKEQFPEHTQEELVSFLKDFRAQRQGKLSGLPFDRIISEISAIIMTKKRDMKLAQAKVLPKNSKILVNKKLVMDPKSTTPAAATVSTNERKKTAWGVVQGAGGGSERRFSGSLEDDCTICYEPMTTDTANKMPCGHVFHRECIHQWLKTKSDCPVCRVLLLLPEEYPSLS